MNRLKIVIHIVCMLIIILLVCILRIEYNDYVYVKELKEVQAGYNEKQKECLAVGTTNNYVYITRTDESGNAISGAVWSVTSLSGDKICEFTTNDNGRGGVVGLSNGEYLLEETSVPEGYTKLENTEKVVFSDYDTSYSLNETNSVNAGAILLVVTDEAGNPVEGIKYNVYDSSYEKIIEIETNEKGLAGVINLFDGVYYVKEYGTGQMYELEIVDSSIARQDITYKN